MSGARREWIRGTGGEETLVEQRAERYRAEADAGALQKRAAGDSATMGFKGIHG